MTVTGTPDFLAASSNTRSHTYLASPYPPGPINVGSGRGSSGTGVSGSYLDTTPMEDMKTTRGEAGSVDAQDKLIRFRVPAI